MEQKGLTIREKVANLSVVGLAEPVDAHCATKYGCVCSTLERLRHDNLPRTGMSDRVVRACLRAPRPGHVRVHTDATARALDYLLRIGSDRWQP